MIRSFRFVVMFVGVALFAQQAAAQESKAAKATRQKLKQVIDFEAKEIGTKAFFEDVNQELEKPIKFKIDNTTGISNNTKLSFKGKKISVEKLLNDLSDKYEFGWVVISNPDNNKIDGMVIIRKTSKGKERGYEAGKEPKGASQSSSLPPGQRNQAVMQPRLNTIESAVYNNKKNLKTS